MAGNAAGLVLKPVGLVLNRCILDQLNSFAWALQTVSATEQVHDKMWLLTQWRICTWEHNV